MHNFLTEAATDSNEAKQKHIKRIKNHSIKEDKVQITENHFDFYKFAEDTAEAVKDESVFMSQDSKQKYSLPPKWLNRRPKLTYSVMCKQAIQVIFQI